MEGSSLNCGWRGIPCCPEVHWDYQVNWDVLSLISWIGRSFNQILNQQILTTPTFGHNFMESIWSKAWIEIPIRIIPPAPIKIHSFQKKNRKKLESWHAFERFSFIVFVEISVYHASSIFISKKHLEKDWRNEIFCCSFKCVSCIVENSVDINLIKGGFGLTLEDFWGNCDPFYFKEVVQTFSVSLEMFLVLEI